MGRVVDERIVDVRWIGPFKWAEADANMQDNHMVYALYGQHHVYGRGSLLYIERTNDKGARLSAHDKWVRYEYDEVEFRCGSIGFYKDSESWKAVKEYPRPADDALADAVESLLILGHQPTYNTLKKVRPDVSHLRVFNSGHFVPLMPETSTLYLLDR